MPDNSSASQPASHLDVYAEPYIPLALKQVNGAPAHRVACRPAPWINFDAYVAAFAGAFFNARAAPTLVLSPPIDEPATLEQHNYDQFFRAALQREIDAQLKDCERYALYQVPLWQNVIHSLGPFRVP